MWRQNGNTIWAFRVCRNWVFRSWRRQTRCGALNFYPKILRLVQTTCSGPLKTRRFVRLLRTSGGNDSMHPIADPSGWHAYSKKWFLKTLFDASPIGPIEPSPDWTFEPSDPVHREKKRAYSPNSGYELIQGKGVATGRLIGGHTGILELEGTCIALTAEDYEGGNPVHRRHSRVF